ncbi:MAG: phage terminase large subunit family protein [Thermoleophilia bacterium]
MNLSNLNAALLSGFQPWKPPLDPRADSLDFVTHHGLRIDGRLFDMDAYSHLEALYRDEHRNQSIMAGAQTGKTGRMAAFLVRLMLLTRGGMFGYYFPTETLALDFSAARFEPLLRSNSYLAALIGRHTENSAKGFDNTHRRVVGPSTVFFAITGGKTGTESFPFDGVFFDEVRRMKPGDIERAEERTSAKDAPFDIKVSTAFYPDSDIHKYFKEGDQRYFHSACNCSEGCVLSLAYPDCVASMEGVTPEFLRHVEHAFSLAGLPFLGCSEQDQHKYGKAVFVCPRCGEIIVNPRDGWWEAHEPGRYVHSWQMSQILSPNYSASRVFHKASRASDVMELWNSMLGLPYLDPLAQPVKLEHLESCVNPALYWAANQGDEWKQRNVVHTAMGSDQMGGFNCVVIKQQAPNGKYRTVHLEVIHGDDPWERQAYLMEEYQVDLAVVDSNPNYNESHRFCKAFPNRVWLAEYTDEKGPLVRWMDKKRQREDQNKAKALNWRWTVRISRTRALQWSLGRWALRQNETPDPDALLQSLPRDNGQVVLTSRLKRGTFSPSRICREVYWVHQQRVAFRKEFLDDDAELGVLKKVVADHVGLDPHFAHADLYANVALARIGGNMLDEEE